jgi:hypothetical protein
VERGVALNRQAWHTEAVDKAALSVRHQPRDPALTGRCQEAKTMSKVDKLKTEIERLPREEFTELVRWLSEKDWERWDKEIEADSEAGRLDFLMREALDEKAKGTLKDL